jgi:hypothetical protein
MTSYSHLSALETLLMTVLSVLSNLAGLPIVGRTLPQRATRFEGIMVGMSIATSLLYHICEIYDCTLFLSELQWHRLDNVFAITSFELIFLHACGSMLPENEGLKWTAFLTALLLQEKDPWNVTYTVAPCIMFLLLAVGIRYYFRASRRVQYDRRNMTIAIVPFSAGLFFFYLGLDDANDYLRIFHCCWHVCASLFGYYCFISVTVSATEGKAHREDGTALQF